MCESPLCMTENEAITLYKASQVQDCVFHIINPYCFYPMIHTVLFIDTSLLLDTTIN